MQERRFGVFPQRKTDMSNNQDQIDQRYFLLRPGTQMTGHDDFSAAQLAAEDAAARTDGGKVLIVKAVAELVPSFSWRIPEGKQNEWLKKLKQSNAKTIEPGLLKPNDIGRPYAEMAEELTGVAYQSAFDGSRFAKSFEDCAFGPDCMGLRPVPGSYHAKRDWLNGCEMSPNFTDHTGSSMVWVPIYALRELPENKIEVWFICAMDIQDRWTGLNQISNDGEWFIPEAFFDGGKIQPGFMYDKYMCSSNGAGVAVSVKGGIPLSSAVRGELVGADFASLGSGIENNIGGAFLAAKTRGEKYFASSWQMRWAINMLTRWYVQDGLTSKFAGFDWPRGLATYPENTTGKHEHDGSGRKCGKTGTGGPALVSHNGRSSGIADTSGLLWGVESGLSALGGVIMRKPIAERMADFHEIMDKGELIEIGEGTQESGYVSIKSGYCRSILQATGKDAEAGYFYGTRDSEEPLCAIGGGGWADGGDAGVWALSLGNARGDSGNDIGFRSAFYL